ncbi:MAG TPA: tetratricopeptide repeat protein, partial [Polyangiaceae bacterium]|nr:tetratricopeptide repeat protein [Polyangiaceae bacterium]
EVAEPELVREMHDPDAPLPSYDLEEISAAAAISDGASDAFLGNTEDSFAARDSQFDLRSEEDLDDYLEDVPHAPDARRALAAPRLSDPRGLTDRPVTASVELIEEALEEAEFFTSRGLVEDARTILVDALARAPNHPLVMERLRELDGAVGAQSGTHERTDPGQLGPVDDRSFDLAASLDALDVLEQATRSSRPPTSLRNVDEIDVDQVFAKFKEGVRAQISDSDSSTHYDLGVAYKEMGLLPDAISEFKIAAKDTRYECTSNAMVGMIQLELGQLDEAAESYIAALGAPQKTIDQEMSLYYDLGNVYEMKGSSPEALYYFQKIARRDPGYRDVRDRIDALEPRRPQPQQGVAGMRQIQSDDELEAAFDDLFESK